MISKCRLLQFLVTGTLLMTGCERPMDKPELVDPLYQDLVRESDSYLKLAESEEKKLKSTRAELEKMEARDQFRKPLTESAYRSEKIIREMKQRSLYFEIRAQQRKEFDREDYLKAFEANAPWPRPGEIHSYELKKKLMYAPRNWDERVPKTTRYNKRTTTNAAKPAEAAHGSGTEEKPAAH